MRITMPCRWLIMLNFVTTLVPFVDITPVHAQSAAETGTAQSNVGASAGGHDRFKSTKPKSGNLDEPARHLRPPDTPGRTPARPDRAEALEERLRRGDMDRPVAQGQISDRLEQFHKGSAERPTGETAAGQSGQ